MNKSIKPESLKVDRRNFLTGVAVAGATAVAATKADAATGNGVPAAPRLPAAVPPTARMVAAETNPPKEMPAHGAGRPNSDFMIDVLKALDIDYCYANPASSYRGIHESLIDYGKNTKPEFITCMHEESAIAMAHGNFKISGKMQMSLCHGTVGLMHGTMAVYNAWCDRVPVMIMGGTDLDAAKRPPGVPTTHSAQDIMTQIRDFSKWDDQPHSLQHYAQSTVRAYKIAMTPPYGPVAISLDAELQEGHEDHDPSLYIPKITKTAPPHADLNALREAARLLVNAENPVIIAGRSSRTQEGVNSLIALAELLQAPVVDQGERMNFPNTHYLNHSDRAVALVRSADVIIGLELNDYWGTVNGFLDNGNNDGSGVQSSKMKKDAKLISISTLEFNQKSNFQFFQKFQSIDVQMAGDAESSLPALIEFVKTAMPADKKDAFAKRGDGLKKAYGEARTRIRNGAALAWEASPISTARLCAEIYAQIKDLDWSLVSQSGNVSGWAHRMWKMEKSYSHIGSSGGSGVGYGLPASIGAAHANKQFGRFSVSIQGDGDFMFAPGALWTAAHHEIPLLTVMHNNLGYHQEVMHVQRMANFRSRVAYNGKDFAPTGTRIENPHVDYAKLASSMGWWSTGPISDPAELAGALKKAVDVVKTGQPALVDVLTQPR